MSPSHYEGVLSELRYLSGDLGIDKTLEKAGVNFIIGPAESGLSMLVSASGQI